MEMCVCCVLHVRMNVSMSKLLKARPAARPAAVNADLILTNKQAPALTPFSHWLR